MRSAAAVAVLACLAINSAEGQVPAGGTFQVNTYTTGGQRSPSVASDAAGNLVVAWARAVPRGQCSLSGQRLDPLGQARGSEFEIFTCPSGSAIEGALVSEAKNNMTVASDARGSFLVAWASDASGWYPDIHARHFDAAGLSRGAEFQVNTYTTNVQASPSIAIDPTGGFAVIWTSIAYTPEGGQDGNGAGVYGQRHDASGMPLGGEFQVNTYTTGDQKGHSVASDGSGNFVVVWSSAGQNGSRSAVIARRYDPAGVPRGPEFQVSAHTWYQEQPVVVSSPAGAFAVFWSGWGAGGTTRDIMGRLYDPSGASLGGEFRVNDLTAGEQVNPTAAADADGNMVVAWQHGPRFGISVRRLTATGGARGPELWVSGTAGYPSVACDPVGNFLVTWQHGSDYDGDIYAQRYGGLVPAALRVDAYPSGYSDGNEVLEQTEAVGVWTWWRNVNGQAQTFDGEGLSFTGPAGAASYVLGDATGAYGTVLNGATAACSDCYALGVSSGVRPAVHWDTTFTERLTPDVHGQTKLWSIHVGESFVDVPRTSPYYRFVETLLHKGVTGGCSADSYCPAEAVTREQLSVFVLVGKEGAGYLPQACTTPVFADVPAASPYCRFVEDLSRRGVVSGCGGGNYCPSSAVTREQMPVFVLKTLEPSLDPPACGTPMFADVPASSPYCKFIEELARRGVVGGCGGGNYCPADAVTREQMAVFISATFGLTLYGP